MDPYSPPELVIEPGTPEFGIEDPAAEVLVVPVTGPVGPQGEQGPVGPPGPPGGGYYVHSQSAPSASWVIDHNLGRRVHVSVFNADDFVVHADVEHGSLNQTSISFPGPVTGTAVLS